MIPDLENAALEAERSVIATMLRDRDAITAARQTLEPQTFRLLAHGKIFAAIVALGDRGAPVDTITVTDELRGRGDLEAAGGPVALSDLLGYPGVTVNLGAYAAIVREAATKRHVRRLALELQGRAEDPSQDVGELVARLEEEAATLSASRAAAGGRFSEASINAVDFGALAIEKPASLLGDGVLTAGGFGILYGKPGLGKSWLAASLSRSLVRGDSWVGIPTRVEGSRVGLLQLELGDYTLQRRLKTLGIGSHDRDGGFLVVARPRLKGTVDLLRPEDLSALRAWIAQDRLNVVVIDALSRAHRADENSAAEFGPVLAAIDSVRHDTGCAILLVHHDNKPREGRDDDDDLSSLRGTSRLQSDPTLLIRVRQSRGLRCIRFPKVSEGPTPEAIYYRLDAAGVPEVVQAPEAVSAGNREKVLALVLGSDLPLSRSQVQSAAGLSESTTLAHLKALVDEGKLAPVGPERGRKYSSPTSRPTEPPEQGTSGHQTTLLDNNLDSFSASVSLTTPSPTSRPPEPPALKGGGRGREVRSVRGGAEVGREDPFAGVPAVASGVGS